MNEIRALAGMRGIGLNKITLVQDNLSHRPENLISDYQKLTSFLILASNANVEIRTGQTANRKKQSRRDGQHSSQNATGFYD